MKALNIIFLLLFISTVSIAQDFEVPAYKFETAKDYDTYEKDVINGISWLMNTPINEQADKRKATNSFLVQWMSGSPKVAIEIKPEIVTFLEAPDLLMTFMGGWTKYGIESGNYKDKINSTMAGLELVIEFYTKNKANMPKSKEVEKYIKMKEKGTLKEYVQKNA